MPIGPEMPVFPGDPPIEVVPTHSLARGDPYSVSALRMGSHSGTHVDPPSHFIPGGVPIDAIDLSALNGPCRVVQLALTEREIGAQAFAGVPRGSTRILFRTANSRRWEQSPRFFDDYVAMSPAAAEVAIARGIRLLGIDSLSIEHSEGEEYPVHRRLLGVPVLILEGLRLGHVAPGSYDLECLPLRVRGGDGGPARAVLRTR